MLSIPASLSLSLGLGDIQVVILAKEEGGRNDDNESAENTTSVRPSCESILSAAAAAAAVAVFCSDGGGGGGGCSEIGNSSCTWSGEEERRGREYIRGDSRVGAVLFWENAAS